MSLRTILQDSVRSPTKQAPSSPPSITPLLLFYIRHLHCTTLPPLPPPPPPLSWFLLLTLVKWLRIMSHVILFCFISFKVVAFLIDQCYACCFFVLMFFSMISYWVWAGFVFFSFYFVRVILDLGFLVFSFIDLSLFLFGLLSLFESCRKFFLSCTMKLLYTSL